VSYSQNAGQVRGEAEVYISALTRSLFCFCSLDKNKDMRDVLGTAKSIEKMKEVCQTLKERIQVCFLHAFGKLRCHAKKGEKKTFIKK